MEIRWCLATLMPTIPPGSPEQGITGQQPEGRPSMGAIYSSQLAVANKDLPTHLPSQGQPSSPDITLLSGHILPDAKWSTLTTLGSDHLPITVSLSCQGKRALLLTTARLTGRDIQQRQRGNSPKYLCQPLTHKGKKSSGVSSATPEDTTSSAVMLGITAALSSMLCDSSSRREIRTALKSPHSAIKLLDKDIQCHILQEAQDQ